MKLSPLISALNTGKYTKADIADRANITRRTLDAVINGSDTRVSTLEAIAAAINVSIYEFFDESTTRYVTHGDNSPIGNNNIVGADPILTERIRSLEQQLQEKDARIADLKETISLLRSYRSGQ